MNNTLTDTNPRAWVGCLGCYNGGTLNGAWVEGINAGDVSLAVKVNLGDPAIYGENCNICAACGSDEFWVFDHENFDGVISGECSPMDAQAAAELLASVDESEREIWQAWLSNGMTPDVDTMRENYIGEFTDAAELAGYFVDNCGLLDGVPDSVARYFDYESYGRDLEYGGDVWSFNGYYFFNH